MQNPKSLVHAMYQHWEVLEQIVAASRSLPAFEPAELENVIRQAAPKHSEEDVRLTTQQLLNSGVLQSLARSSALQLNPIVLEFMRSVLHEHELSLSEVLKARIDGIRGANHQLAEAITQQQTDDMRRAAMQLSDIFRQIHQQLDQDRHAILNLADAAKRQDANIPLAQRYREVLAADAQYLQPMNEMLDSGLGGTFYPQLERAEQLLDQAVYQLESQGTLYTQRLAIRSISFQIKALRSFARLVLKQCVETIFPLREELRQHNRYSAAISALLGRVRKRGLSRSLPIQHLPVWQRGQPRRLQIHDELLDIMQAAGDFQPVTLDFPADDLSCTAQDQPVLFDHAALQAALLHAVPIENVLLWLLERYPQLSDQQRLDVYFSIGNQPHWQIEIAEQRQSCKLQQMTVHYYPHAIVTQTLAIREEHTG